MSARPRLLDFYCCAGGAGVGYARAGFEVVGVDVEPQPNYPFEFVQADALATLRMLLAGGRLPSGLGLVDFDGAHASPPCKATNPLRHLWPDREHLNLIPETRELLIATGLPYVIENVPGAARWLRDPVMLCGTMFGLGAAGRDLWRHRLFECSFSVRPAATCSHRGSPIGVYGTGAGGQHPRGLRASADEAREAV